MLTQARLKELLDYDPETGVFRWRRAPGKRARNDLVGKVAGSPSRRYVTIRIDGKLHFAQRLAWLYVYGEWPNGEADHKNLIRSDNRIDNLRDATHQQNTRNQSVRSNSRSKVTGVAWDKQTKRWRAHITVDAKMQHLGRFDDFETAVAARRQAELALFGEFARAA